MNIREARSQAETAASSSRRALWVSTLATVLIMALCVLVGASLTRLIAPRIGRATAALKLLAAKDLTARVRVTGTDEIGQMGEALNASVASLRSLVESVAKGADTISTTTNQMSA